MKAHLFSQDQVYSANASTTTPSARAVLDYSNPDLVERIQKKLELPADQAEILFKDLIKFLSLCAFRMDDSRAPLVPPKKIDEAWHHFLLFTEEYAAFCETFFGGFVHHQPSTRKTPLRGNRIADTIALAGMIYGDLSENWSTKWLAMDAQCGGTTNCQVCYR